MLPSYLRSCHTCLAACIVIACGGPASADDSEIFFNPAARAGVRPNVLLILDTSRGPDENEAGFPAVVKSAAAELLRSLDGVNVGLMRLSNNDVNRQDDAAAEGGMVVHAVVDIESIRESLLAAVESYAPDGHAPLAESLFEAGQYLAGRKVDYGQTSRIDAHTSFPSVASSRKAGDAERYRSPIEFQCQRNFVVLISDGRSEYDNSADTKIASLPGFSMLAGACEGEGPGRCLPAMAKYLFESDLSSMPGQQNALVYTIDAGGDESGSSLLQRTARAGGGAYISLANTGESSEALRQILGDIQDQGAVFTAPAVSVGSFQSTQSLDDLYVSQFRPAATLRWQGNLKKYALRGGHIIDAEGREAVDAATSLFQPSARSFWSTVTDGDQVELGGAASRLPEASQRRLLTHLPGAGTRDLTAASNAFSTENELLTADALGIDASGPTRERLIQWALGVDVQDEDADGDTVETARFMGDAMHAPPAVVIYGEDAESANPADAVVFLPANDGFLHAIDARTGRELWAFIPFELLQRLPHLYANSPATERSYGLDGQVQILRFDSDQNGAIDAGDGDRVWIYFGMRRGGRHYYALDVTRRDHPILLWKLGPSELPGVGETWSVPTIARVRVAGAAQNGEHAVLLFGGGYDEAQEGYHFTTDSTGNRLFMVDAAIGALLWYAGKPGDAGNPDLPLEAMTHSIPGRIVVIDTNGDRFADRLYAADAGGRVWRFDIWNGRNRSELVTGGVFASLGNAHEAMHPIESTRRFYYAPDVALIQRRGADPYYNLAIGSGYRGHPLHAGTQDGFYSLRDRSPFTRLTQSEYESLAPITEDDLVDITADMADASVPPDRAGWMLRLGSSESRIGEKVLSEAITLSGVVMFATYQPLPPDAANPCAPINDRNRAYALQVDMGGPAIDFDDDGNITAADASIELAQGGTAGGVHIFTEPSTNAEVGAAGEKSPDDPSEGPESDPLRRRWLCMVGVEVLGACVKPGGLIRTYWQRPGIH